MSRKPNNYIGMRVGNLMGVRKLENPRSRFNTWLMKCDCGAEVIKTTKQLIDGSGLKCDYCKLNSYKHPERSKLYGGDI